MLISEPGMGSLFEAAWVQSHCDMYFLICCRVFNTSLTIYHSNDHISPTHLNRTNYRAPLSFSGTPWSCLFFGNEIKLVSFVSRKGKKLKRLDSIKIKHVQGSSDFDRLSCAGQVCECTCSHGGYQCEARSTCGWGSHKLPLHKCQQPSHSQQRQLSC